MLLENWTSTVFQFAHTNCGIQSHRNHCICKSWPSLSLVIILMKTFSFSFFFLHFSFHFLFPFLFSFSLSFLFLFIFLFFFFSLIFFSFFLLFFLSFFLFLILFLYLLFPFLFSFSYFHSFPFFPPCNLAHTATIYVRLKRQKISWTTHWFFHSINFLSSQPGPKQA